MKLISFIRRRPPNDPMRGYSDHCTIYEDGNPLADFECRTTPNAFRPSDNKPWDVCYGVIALGTYNGMYCYDNSKPSRLCVVIENGRTLPAAMPNINHEYKHEVSNVEVHCGFADDDPKTPWNESWPGSKACLTIKPTQWLKFQSFFVIGEKVKIEIRGIE